MDGKQTLRYVWKQNPRNCHGGVSLPLPVESACCTPTFLSISSSYDPLATTAVCTAGTHLTGKDECQPCRDGTFSIGNGEVFSSFATIDPFKSTCEGEDRCRVWSVHFGDLVAGTEKSTLSLIRNFKSSVASSVAFEYKLVAHQSSFVFRIDGETVLSDSDRSTGVRPLPHNVLFLMNI